VSPYDPSVTIRWWTEWHKQINIKTENGVPVTGNEPNGAFPTVHVTLVSRINGDAVCLWKGDSQKHISSVMNTIILLFHFPFFRFNANILDFIMVPLWNRADHYIFILWFLSIFHLSIYLFFPRLISAATH